MILKNLGVQIFGSRNQRMLKGFKKIVIEINALEDKFVQYTDEQIKASTAGFKDRIANGESLDQILPEAFAVVREASKRTLGLRHYDVQLIGGMILHSGRIVEMCTGEGKTLSATLPAYLNALTGRGVHIVTVNPYLAERDAKWMEPIYNALGLTVGIILPELSRTARQDAYNADITYVTNNEVGFDYLRDHMVTNAQEVVQRDLAYAIIDEVDSVLIDEARTPLIISGSVQEDVTMLQKITGIAMEFEKSPHGVQEVNVLDPEKDLPEEGDFVLDEKEQQIYLTEAGHSKFESILLDWGVIAQKGELYSPQNAHLLHVFNACLRARYCFAKDVDYIVQDGSVVIVDEHTGRTMPGRRWSDSLHQAIEAKEGVKVLEESRTLASVTFQNYFKLYGKLAGMTGTADTEAYELDQIYQLEVIVLPTNKPMQRIDYNDRMYITKQEKLDAIVADIKERNSKGQPILVGTSSIESSEEISALLTVESIKHEVLNAKNHAREADIIAQAGALGSVTIATNMAGRGTDIVLGGAEKTATWSDDHEKVKQLGGLYVLGAERNESRRIDNQLRGRSGRQGDPGETRYYLSLDDNLIRIFATEKVKNLIARLSDKQGQALEQPMLTRSIESAQRKVEGHYFTLRKNLLKFDMITAEQRSLVYEQRKALLDDSDVSDNIRSMIVTVIDDLLEKYNSEDGMIAPDSITEIVGLVKVVYKVELQMSKATPFSEVRAALKDLFNAKYDEQRAIWQENASVIEKGLMLQVLDQYWQNHLSTIENLRLGIHLRGYAQKDPVQEFKQESFSLFEAMLLNMKQMIISQILNLNISYTEDNVSRNSECPCGSGLRYKKCCGRIN